jgi:hypothetical protein
MESEHNFPRYLTQCRAIVETMESHIAGISKFMHTFLLYIV